MFSVPIEKETCSEVSQFDVVSQGVSGRGRIWDQTLGPRSPLSNLPSPTFLNLPHLNLCIILDLSWERGQEKWPLWEFLVFTFLLFSLSCLFPSSPTPKACPLAEQAADSKRWINAVPQSLLCCLMCRSGLWLQAEVTSCSSRDVRVLQLDILFAIMKNICKVERRRLTDCWEPWINECQHGLQEAQGNSGAGFFPTISPSPGFSDPEVNRIYPLSMKNDWKTTPHGVPLFFFLVVVKYTSCEIYDFRHF